MPAFVEVLEDRTLLSAFTVVNLNDSGAGSLREAVAAANAHAGADLIRFQGGLAGTIALTSGQMEITGDLTIDGPGANRVTISGNNASRVFKMGGAGTDVAIDDLTIANGRNTIKDNVGIIVTRGGAILNDGGALTLSRVTFLNNQAIDPSDAPGSSQVVGGGAVVNSGNAKLTVTHCTFIGNTASGGLSYAFGGAIANVTNSIAVVEDSTFIGNQATGGTTNYGGAIGNFGSSQLTVTGCAFDSNAARAFDSGTGPGDKAFGGAIATRPGTVVSSGSTTTIDRSSFTNNRALGGAGQTGGDAGGGALYNVESTLIVNRSNFVGNKVLGGKGFGSGGNAFGGAIDSTAVNLANTPLTRIGTSLFLCNQAISGNGGPGGLAAGGALYNSFGRMDVIQSCIVSNLAIGGSNGQGIGGGIYTLGTFYVDRPTLRGSLFGNFASTSHDNSFGILTPI